MGGVEDTRTVEFTIDGVVEAGEEVTLGPDEEHDGEFTWEAEEIGEFEVEIRSGDHSEELTIQIVEEEVPPETETDYGGLYAAVGFIVMGLLVLIVLVKTEKGGKDLPVLEKKGDESAEE